jgi:dolichol-phosphate mannosyltransferase
MIEPCWPALTVVIPTFNERANVRPLVARLEAALDGIDWEAVFVDDDSPDGTAAEVTEVAAENHRIRLLHRKGQRGLAGACIQGILGSTAPVAAVIDADLQHDETRLRAMYDVLAADPALDLVIGSRNVAGGSSSGGLSRVRQWGSERATALTLRLLRIHASDPMSGFFMVRRPAFNEVATGLQGQGFKLLADMLAAARGRWKVAEVPYEFRPRVAGESKMDGTVALEFLGLLITRLTSGLLPIRLVLFGFVGLTGVFVQLAVVRLAMAAPGLGFEPAQALGVVVAMTSNFALNNAITWRERRLRGRAFLRGLISFYAVCSVGALINLGVASAVFHAVPEWALASVVGAVAGAIWNFWASLLVTWRAP